MIANTFIRNATNVCLSESRESKIPFYSVGLHTHEADPQKHKYKGKRSTDLKKSLKLGVVAHNFNFRICA